MRAESLANLVYKPTPPEILSETISYTRYLKVWHRKTRFADGRIIEWDVAGHTLHLPTFAITLPYNTQTKSVTVLVEYAQGTNEMLYNLPGGAFDPLKHVDIQTTAENELNEEARLKNGEWIPLMDPTCTGIAELKWCRNKFIPFLVLDPVDDPQPLARDPEELIEVCNIPLSEWRACILSGKVCLPAVQTTIMALEVLKKRGLIDSADLLL